ncbi:MAG: hypothetical protein ACT4OM_04345 [Actinomycetota bacterium]
MPQGSGSCSGERPQVIVSAIREIGRIGGRPRPYRAVAYALGALMILSGLFHLLVFLVDGGSWSGPVSWRKPVTFGLSFGITTVTLAWIAGLFSERLVLKATLLAVAFACVLEVLLVGIQRWRGVPSHFNEATRFDAAVFQGMGIAVSVIGLGIVVLTALAFGRVAGGSQMAVAVRAGLLLLLAAQALGAAIIANGQRIGRPPEETDLAIFGAAGVMKLSHAVAMHGIQVLPALAVLLSVCVGTPSRRLLVMWPAVGAYVALVAAAVVQMLQGRAPADLSPVSALTLASAAILAALAVARLMKSTSTMPRANR